MGKQRGGRGGRGGRGRGRGTGGWKAGGGGKSRQTVVFDEDARVEFITGFRKRKQQRREKAQEELKEKARLAKIEERREIKESWMEMLTDRGMTYDEAVALPEKMDPASAKPETDEFEDDFSKAAFGAEKVTVTVTEGLGDDGDEAARFGLAGGDDDDDDDDDDDSDSEGEEDGGKAEPVRRKAPPAAAPRPAKTPPARPAKKKRRLADGGAKHRRGGGGGGGRGGRRGGKGGRPEMRTRGKVTLGKREKKRRALRKD